MFGAFGNLALEPFVGLQQGGVGFLQLLGGYLQLLQRDLEFLADNGEIALQPADQPRHGVARRDLGLEQPGVGLGQQVAQVVVLGQPAGSFHLEPVVLLGQPLDFHLDAFQGRQELLTLLLTYRKLEGSLPVRHIKPLSMKSRREDQDVPGPSCLILPAF